MKNKTFEVKEEHIKLLRNACTGWDDCEFGAPGLNCKRPYGNSDVFGDMARILGIKLQGDGGCEPTDEQAAYMLKLHTELETVLQIIFSTGRMETGWYEEVKYYEWVPISKESAPVKKTYEVRGVHSLNYFAVVKANSQSEALEEADLHNLIDDNFWHDDPDSWRFEILGAEELEDE